MRIKGWHLHLPFKEEILQNLYLQYKIKIYGYFSNLKDFQMQPQFIAQYISKARIAVGGTCHILSTVTALRVVYLGQR